MVHEVTHNSAQFQSFHPSQHVAGREKAVFLTGQVLEHVAGQKRSEKMPGHVLRA